MKYIQISLLLLCAIASSAQGYSIKDYKVDIDINKDGTFLVHEKLKVDFAEKRRGIFRNIPNKIIVQGKTQRVKVSQVKVADHKHQFKKEGNEYIIRIGDKNIYLEGEQTYEFSYLVSNAFVFNDHNTEFQYNLITDWDSTIDRFDYNISLPTNLEMSPEEYVVVTGDHGAQEKHVSISKEFRNISGRSLTQIQAKENVSVYLNLPADYITRPVPPVPLIQRDKYWFAPLALLFGVIAFFNRTRKQDISALAQKTVHFPPEGFSPAMVGSYYDQKVHTEDVISLIPYWADQGHVKILKGEEDLFFERVSSLSSSAPEYQRNLFERIFASNELVMLSDLKEKMYMHVHKAKKHIRSELLGRNLYDDKEYKLFHNGYALIIGIILIIAGILFAATTQLIFSGISISLIGSALFIFHFTKPKKSEKGIRLQQHLISLKTFLSDGADNNIQDLLKKHPNYFEKMYPYAIAFGIDNTWINKMKEYSVETPSWYGYQSGHGHDRRPSFDSFTNDFKVQEISSVFTSAPVASSSGGSSGGGFSGGAGGGFGGGGGSW